MCGGVLYESLVQSLAVDGINLPETVVQRGIGYDVVHLDSNSVCIQTPRREKKIATTFRGICPRGLMELEATRQIRAKGSKVHIITMIASAMQGDREECLAAGMDDYVSKPIQVKELQAALERCRETTPKKPY
jgi:CheY-like chemotaxis protein